MPAAAGAAVRAVLITLPLSDHARDVTVPLLTVPGVAVKVVAPAVPLLGLIDGCAVKVGAAAAAVATVTCTTVDCMAPPEPVAVS